METNIQKGPIALAQKFIADGSIAKCTVNKMWSWFVGKDLQKDQTELWNSLKQQFVTSKYSVRALVKAIVKTREYREGSL